MAISLRAVQKADLQEVQRLCIEHAEFERVKLPETPKERLSQLVFGEPPALYCLVAETRQALVGYATYMKQVSTWEARHYLYLDCLYIKTEFRGKGLGKRMMRYIAVEAARLDCLQIQWQTPEFNEAAICFYQCLGAAGKPKTRFAWNFASESPT